MIDVHNHILPRIDDGAKSWEESINIAIKAVENGINTIIATPHHMNGTYSNEPEKVVSLVEELNGMLKERDIPLTIIPGHETRIYGEFISDLISEKIITFNNKYVLVELPYSEVPHYMDQFIFEIQMKGFVPIIPHPERNTYIRENPIKIYQMVKNGAITQITAGSLLGTFGKEVKHFSYELIDHNLTHLIATDAHTSTGVRGINLKEAYDELIVNRGNVCVEAFKSNAKNIIQGIDLYINKPYKIEMKKKRFGLF